ncbi:MAG: hypothetical protein Q7R96_04680, partial [Nanoarchaeota archaeon]|nr:hypothetical protein [Nanoarchaeota archaeon]
MNKTILLSILVIISSLQVTASTATITASTCPGGSDTLLKISSLTNAHAELYNQNNYAYNVCSPFTLPGATRTCDGNNQIITLSGITNAHVGNNYNTPVCYGNLACSIETGTTCPSSDTCLFSISALTNAHVAQCGFYNNQVCCSSATGTTDNYPTDPCSTQTIGDQCGTPACPSNSPTCGSNCNNGIINSGETCATCYADAGCDLGTICCTNGNAASCTNSCTTPAPGPGCKPGLQKNSQGVCVCNPIDDNICLTGTTCDTNEDPDCTETCDIQTATWSTTQPTLGQTIQLSITTTQTCNGEQATFTIYEDDPNGDTFDDASVVTPPAVTVTAGKATTTWLAEYADDGILGGDPEYYFEAATATSLPKRSSIVTVKKSGAGPTCGNNKQDTGENCFTCSNDAGCGNEEICCSSGTTGTCKASCSTGETPYTPGCIKGLLYDSDDELCICKTTKDN